MLQKCFLLLNLLIFLMWNYHTLFKKWHIFWRFWKFSKSKRIFSKFDWKFSVPNFHYHLVVDWVIIPNIQMVFNYSMWFIISVAVAVSIVDKLLWVQRSWHNLDYISITTEYFQKILTVSDSTQSQMQKNHK